MSLKPNYFVEEVKFKLANKRKLTHLLKSINLANRNLNGEVNYIFCTDAYLIEINRNYLKHDTYTDIITFENYDPSGLLMADIFISIERVEENAKQFEVSFERELIRVICHGMLHISGYKDKTKTDKLCMTEKENEYIDLYFNTID